MSRLLLLDGHSLAYRAFFALPAENFSTSTGQTTNAVYGFTSMLINMLRDEDPTHLAVAFDLGRQTFRAEAYAEYKAGRATTPDEFRGQISLIHEVLDALKIPHFEVAGYEADDIIATFTSRAQAADGFEVVIVSGDRDTFQLVDERTTILYPVRGVSEVWRMGPAQVRERYGVGPERYCDLAALVGESSDNLPGVPGVGPKTAAKWLTEYGDLAGLVAHVDRIKGKAGQSLRDNLESVLRNRRLNELVRDVDLPVSMDELARRSWDREEVHKVFDGLEFRVLRDRLFATLSAPEPEAESGFEVGGTRLTSEEVADWLQQHAGPGLRVGVHPVGTWAPGRGDIEAVGLAAGTAPAPDEEPPAGGSASSGSLSMVSLVSAGSAGTAGSAGPAGPAASGSGPGYEGLAAATQDATVDPGTTARSAAYIVLTDLDPAAEAAFAAWLADPDRPKVMHDAKGPMHAFAARGLGLAGLVSDTSLAAYLIRPDQRSYDLADLSLRYLRRELRSDPVAGPDGGRQGVLDFSVGAQDADGPEADAAMLRARAVLDLSVELDRRLHDTGGTELLRDLELPLIEVLARMERAGIAVDAPLLTSLETEFADKVAQAQQDAWDAIGGQQVNLGSPKQLQVVLFEQLNMPKTKRTKTGYTTDADALAELYAKTEHPFLEALLRHRDSAKLRVTVEGLIKSVADDGRVHTTYQQNVAATGRLSSTDPNLQNIPIRTEEGRRIRDVFVVGDRVGADGAGPFESLMSADYSQIEMRVMAHLSGDPGLIEAFHAGEDLHRFVGSRVFAVEPEQVTPAMRSKIKAMSYGLAYGLSAFGLSRQLGISTGEAGDLMNGYFERFGGVRDYLREVVAQARSTGYTETMLGRRRYLPDLTSDNRQRREMAERMALNAPIQGSAADIMKLAMLNIDRALTAGQARSRVLLQVHDELVLEVASGEGGQVADLVRREMGHAVELDVPLEVHIGTGRSWHDAEH